MFIFPLYAVLVWYLAAKYRRRWQGFAIVAASVLLIVLVGFFHAWLGEVTRGRFQVGNMRIILIGYGALIGFIGLFIACLGREQPWHCQFCGYNLLGHAEANPRCPECGRVSALKKFARGLCRYCGQDLKKRGEDPTLELCAGCRHAMVKARAFVGASLPLLPPWATPDASRSSADQAIQRPGDQHERGQARDERQAQHQEAPIVHGLDDRERARRRALRDEIIHPREP